jgi:cytoskeletal protein CcmA (bactofilin family)
MAQNVTIIGRTTRVRGRVQGTTDLEVHGFVEGDISVSGDVTIAQAGIVGANVKGRRLLVRGAVKGDLTGDEAILLEDGARVAGDVRAPRVAIAPGALVRGYVQTGEAGNASPRAVARAQPAARPAVSSGNAVSAHAAHAPERVAPAPAKPQAKSAPLPARATSSAASAGPRRPPPPVVPVLKGAKGQVAKKKER